MLLISTTYTLYRITLSFCTSCKAKTIFYIKLKQMLEQMAELCKKIRWIFSYF